MSILCSKQLRASFSRCLNAVNVLFRSLFTSMYTPQLWRDFRKAYIHRWGVAYNFGCRVLWNLPWRASVSSRQVQCNIPTFEVLSRKNVLLFLEKSPKMYGYGLWCSQIVYIDIRPYSLNATTAFYFVTECPKVTLLVWGRVHPTTHSHFTRP